MMGGGASTPLWLCLLQSWLPHGNWFMNCWKTLLERDVFTPIWTCWLQSASVTICHTRLTDAKARQTVVGLLPFWLNKHLHQAYEYLEAVIPQVYEFRIWANLVILPQKLTHYYDYFQFYLIFIFSILSRPILELHEPLWALRQY